jgi:hypothetical protein
MKKILFIFIAGLAYLPAGAQNFEKVKTLLMLTQYQKAKEEVDKNMLDAKFAGKPEAYILKASIYGALAMDEKNKTTETGYQLTRAGDSAFHIFRQMDPAMQLLGDPAYQNGLVNLYSSFYLLGYNDYSLKQWNTAHAKMKKAVEYSDLLIENKIVKSPLDTNVLILAGITAENSGNKDDADRYYGRLAENKVTGDGFESVYRYMVSQSFQKKDMAAFEKYKNLGASLYPSSEFFKYDKVDFAVGLESTFAAKLKAMEEMLKKDPNNFKANQVLGEIIYDELNPKDESTPLPFNAGELEKKMIAAFNAAARAKPGYEISFIYIGDHFINKAVRFDNERNKPGVAEAKKTTLDAEYNKALLSAQYPYEKAAAIFEKRATLSPKDKQQYKKATSYLVDIASHKKLKAATGSAERKKWEEEEKRWGSIYDSIK